MVGNEYLLSILIPKLIIKFMVPSKYVLISPVFLKSKISSLLMMIIACMEHDKDLLIILS